MTQPEQQGGAEDSLVQAFAHDLSLTDDLARIFRYERHIRQGLFDKIYEHLSNMLPYEKDTSGSLFTIPLSSGRFLLLHALIDYERFGACHHLLVNGESGDKKTIRYAEYVVPEDFSVLNYAQAVATKPSASQPWSVPDLGRASLIEKRADHFVLLRGAESPLVLPKLSWYPETKEGEQMQVTMRLRELLSVLEMASPTTYDENIVGQFI